MIYRDETGGYRSCDRNNESFDPSKGDLEGSQGQPHAVQPGLNGFWGHPNFADSIRDTTDKRLG